MKKQFKQGLVVVLPILATIGIINWIIGGLDSILTALMLPSNIITVFIGLVAVWAITVFSGAVLNGWFREKLHMIVNKIPILKNIYNFFNDIVSVVVTDGKFDTVVKVKFAGQHVIGLLTNAEEGIVFVPTAPNVSSGFVLYVDEWEEVDMAVEEAVKQTLSLGVTGGKK